jgi:glucosylceramidase
LKISIKLRNTALAVGIFLLSGLFSCNDKEPDPPDPPPPPGPSEIGKAQLYLTRGDQTKLFNKEFDLSIKDSLASSFPLITIDTATAFQAIEGFGAALTGSSAYLFNQKMGQATRTDVLTDLFDPVEGIGISFLRLTIGASDFSLSNFSYDDMPYQQTDFDLEHFTMAQDTQDVIPVLQEILQVSPGIKLMGSPWSPPAWMKTGSSMEGGKLKTECYDVYARYFVRYIKEMESRGIDIYAITPQNEPLYWTANYPCMEMQATDQIDFIKNFLGPDFQAQGIGTKIIVYDHNWDVPEYAISVMNDPIVKQYVAGSAFHAYAGNVTAMSTVHFAHPDKALYFTEISGGDWATNFSDNLMWYMSNILIGTVQNWSTTALFWNLCLNEFGAPHNDGCSTCRGVITWKTNGTLRKNEEYYAIAHFSKLVRPGALRLAYTKPQDLSALGLSAFLNPDGTKVMVAANYKETDQTFSVNQGNKYFTYTIPAKSVATFYW